MTDERPGDGAAGEIQDGTGQEVETPITDEEVEDEQ